MHAIALAFILCAADAEREDAPPDTCEAGETRAASCQQAEAWMRAGLREGQTIHIQQCQSAASPGVADRGPGANSPASSPGQTYPAAPSGVAGAFGGGR
jgi:hypothetical protein